MEINNNIIGRTIKLAAAVTALFVSLSALSFLSMAAVPVSWNSLSLTEDGAARWSISYPSTESVEKYELRFARMSGGVWKEDYKTVTTKDDSYDISWSSTGKYYFRMRVRFIGGEYSDWSTISSNTVTVTSDDIDRHRDPVSPYGPYNPYNPYYPYYPVQPAGPGGASAGSGSNVIVAGPGGASGSYSYNYGTAAYGAGSQTLQNATSGWVKVNAGWIYRYANGTGPANAWDRIDDKWYYFDANGIMHTGWLYLNGSWYYCLPDGRMATGWNNVNDKWYYLNEAGIMQTGYIYLDGKTYYCDISGARVQSAYNPDGHLFDLNGEMVR